MSESLKSEERVIIQVDPFTNEVIVQNFTRYPEAEVQIVGDSGEDEQGNHVVSITATFVFKKAKK